MGVVANMIVAFKTDIGDFVRGNRSVRNEAKQTESMLKRMKTSFGEESGLGNIAKMLRGAGAIAGVTVLAQQFGKLGEAADKFSQAMARGEMSSRDLYTNLIQTAPILGDLHKGAMGIWNAFSPLGPDTRDADKKQTDITKSLRDQLKLASAFDDKDKARLQAQLAHEKRLDAIYAAGKETKDQYTVDKQTAWSEQLRDSELRRIERESAAAENKQYDQRMSFLRELRDQSESVGQSPMFRDMLEARKRIMGLGGTDEDAQQARQLIKERYERETQMEVAERRKQQQERAKAVREQADPMAGFRAQLQEAREFVSEGLWSEKDFGTFGRSLVDKMADGGGRSTLAGDWSSRYMDASALAVGDRQTDLQREANKLLEQMIEQQRRLVAVFGEN